VGVKERLAVWSKLEAGNLSPVIDIIENELARFVIGRLSQPDTFFPFDVDDPGQAVA